MKHGSVCRDFKYGTALRTQHDQRVADSEFQNVLVIYEIQNIIIDFKNREWIRMFIERSLSGRCREVYGSVFERYSSNKYTKKTRYHCLQRRSFRPW